VLKPRLEGKGRSKEHCQEKEEGGEQNDRGEGEKGGESRTEKKQVRKKWGLEKGMRSGRLELKEIHK